MNCNAMVKGNALFMVIVIAMIIGILCSALIVVSFVYKRYAQQDYRKQKLELNAISGVNLMLTTSGALPYDEPRTIDLFGVFDDSIIIKRVRWGLFDVGISRSFSKGLECAKVFQMGSKPSGLSKAAIYLVDDGSALAVSGKTVINGTCFLPERGVRGAEVSGFHFSGNNYVTGVIKKSSRKLPEINKEPIDAIISLLEDSENKIITGSDSSQNVSNVDSVFRSFLSTPLYVFRSDALVIDRHYVGQIFFKSNTIIVVEKEAMLEDVILIAPAIIIKSGFKGSLQAFATDTLAVEDDCTLKYPSVLGIIKKDFSHDQPTIMVGQGTIFSGFIFSYQRAEDLRKTRITLQSATRVYGYVYSDGFLELKGDVTGGVMCKKFILNTASTFFENHLLNVTIDNTKLSSDYLLPSMVETKKQKKIIKWLH